MEPTLATILALLDARFKSGNSVPVERIHIKRQEFELLRNLIAKELNRGSSR
jgi:hypothetical protein